MTPDELAVLRALARERFVLWQQHAARLGYRRRVQRARIIAVVTYCHGKHADKWDRAAVLVTVDATISADADRQQRNLKAWRAERLSFVACVLGAEPSDEPTADDYAACVVAADLVEECRDREAEQLLIQQAPRRHNRPCPACGVIAGRPCREPGAAEARFSEWPNDGLGGYRAQRDVGERIVPHLSRVEVRSRGSSPSRTTSVVEAIASARLTEDA